MRRLLVMLVLTGCFLSACGGVSPETPVTQPPGGAPGSTLAAGPDAKAPAPGVPSQQSAGNAALNNRLLRRSATAGAPADLPLGPGDLIEVVVFEVPELSNLKVRVSRPGIVVLPLIGQIPVTGKTPAELEADLRERLGQRFMHDPHVTVFVHERKSQRISVIGAVRKGGVFELSGRLRLADALALAEGLADDADHIVYLFRRVPRGPSPRPSPRRATRRVPTVRGATAAGPSPRPGLAPCLPCRAPAPAGPRPRPTARGPPPASTPGDHRGGHDGHQPRRDGQGGRGAERPA